MTIALRLLTRREYSRKELQDKLLHAGFDGLQIQKVLDSLKASSYQDDQRYVEMLTRTRLRQGHGPLRLRQDLQRAGVDVQEHDGMAVQSVNWQAQAQAAYQKRFGNTAPEDARDYARRARFLAGRGFLPEQIRHVLADPGKNPDDFND
ncbi:regulatory protein RecX [Acidithiobacillus concretivorus]|uniref:Regulatory protein RecX n=1 Tax=Acidithiobacillus concretivorus TaxID=3063952 RepID=A0ABS5ZS13_9PROT|nr:regulatory protein RecX [Acidithiobacillus concretivorus]MBU2738764.1 regulatory protein RecX [Acidithiobacillus concretivorus]